MGVDGLAALVFGRLFDLKGIIVLIIITAIAALFVPTVFMGGSLLAIIGMMLWGMGLGVQESIMRALIADLVDINRRGSAYGVMNMCFGISWFLGSAMMGVLYDIAPIYLVGFSMIAQLLSLPLFFAVRRIS